MKISSNVAKGIVKTRKILADGRIIYSVDVITKPAEGNKPAETKTGSLMLTKEQIQTLLTIGETIPKVDSSIDCAWSVSADGTQSQEWLSL